MNAISPFRITEPGVYDLPADVYHRDPCPTPSLSSTGAKQIIHETPADYWHSRQNPVRKRAFDIGNASHLLTLEPELFDDRVVTVHGFNKKGDPSDGYETQDARDQRDRAYAEGKVPLLVKEIEMVRAMRDAVWSHPIAKMAFVDGKAEQSLFWRDPEFDIWCRSRPDWMPTHPRYLVNLKTADSAHTEDIRKQVWNLAYFQSSAWEMDAYEATAGIRPERYALVVVSKKLPHLVNAVWLDDQDLFDGHRLNRKARGIFARCLETGHWPGAQQEVAGVPTMPTISVPGWARNQLNLMDERGEFDAPQDALMAEAAE